MAPPEMISLFREQPDPPRRPMYFLASILIHGGVISLIWFGIASIPQVDTQAVTAHSMVRSIDLKTPHADAQAANNGIVDYPSSRRAAPRPAAESNDARRSSLRLVAKAQPGRQTLIQPDVADPVRIQEDVPVPMVALWTPSKMPVKEIVAPAREEPAASNATPSLERPNEETTLADVNLAASKAAEPNIATPTSTTSPVVVDRPEQLQQAPQTISQSDAPPAPATVLSLSDLEMKEGTITLPPVNERARAEAQGELAPGKAQQAETDRSGTGRGADGRAGTDITEETETPTAPHASGPEGEPNGGRKGYASGAEQSARLGTQQSSTAISLPRDGRFSAVIVGSSLADQFPEVKGIWSSRMAYVVYVHVGLARSWILQYSLTGDDEAVGGAVMRLDSPWPYNIVRPNLAPNAIESDALMVHGLVNTSGRFEALRIVFPQAFSQADFVLGALEKWQFRPAMQNGNAISVEVLLIIPGDIK